MAGANNLIYALMPTGGRRGLYIYDIDRGEAVETVFMSKQYDIEDVVFDPATAQVIGVRYIDDMKRIRFTDHNLDDIQRRLEAAARGEPRHRVLGP